MVKLETYRLMIRDNTPEDIGGYHRLFSCEDSMTYLPGMLTQTTDESLENLNESISESKKRIRRRFFFAIVDRKSDKYIGQVGFTKLSESLGGLGYFILPEYRKNGFATEAARRVIRYAFEDLGMTAIHCGCHTDNKASEKVMINLGMKKIFETDERLEYEITKSSFA